MYKTLDYLKGLDGKYKLINSSNNNNYVFYNKNRNNMVVFTSHYPEATIKDIVNGTVEGYEYLISVLNKKFNIIVNWSKTEGTTSDYEIYYSFNPESFSKKCHIEIVKELHNSLKSGLKYKYVDVHKGIAEPIKDGVNN